MSDSVHIELATARQVPAIAALHLACLPDSMISMLGPAAVERYYDLVTTSATEHVFVAGAGGEINRQDAKDAKQKFVDATDLTADQDPPDPSTAAWRSRRLGGSSSGTGAGAASTGIAAACVLSLEPQTVMSRFARAAPLRLAANLARGTLGAAFRRRLLARVREGASAAPGVPEVTQFFTDAAHRGRGLGSALLRACEGTLGTLGHRSYCIHTLRDDNDAGIRFYRREGFTESGTSRSFGDHYLVMTKGLR